MVHTRLKCPLGRPTTNLAPHRAYPPEGTTFDFSPPGFLLRDPVAVAEQAALGAGGAAQVTGTQDFFREVLELIEDETWLSGILQFKPVRVTPPSQGASFIGHNPKPNAAVPAPTR